VAGIDDPFIWATFFRLLAGALGWCAVAALCLASRRWVRDEEQRRWCVRALCALWFVPYLAVRTSSESQSGALLALALALLALTRRSGALLAAGLLLGLAFESRYTTGLVAASVVAWLGLRGGERLRALWVMAGMAPALVLGALLDRWGYGDWVFPAWNYVVENLRDGRAAAQFGALPWHAYLWLPLRNPFAPLVALLLAGVIAFWVRRPGHLLTWATLPYVLVHALIAHKEARFLFPLAFVAPVLATIALGELRPWPPLERVRGARVAAGGLAVLNAAGLGVLCLVSSRPEVSFQRFVYESCPQRFEAWLPTPFSPWVRNELTMHFYRPARLDLHQASAPADAPRFNVVMEGVGAVPTPPPGYACTVRYQSLPSWVSRVEPLTGPVRLPAFTLYRCARGAVPAVRPRACCG
jgi:phosphatidylinositol glycan class B